MDRDTIQAELTRRGLPFVFVPYFDAVRHGVSLRVWWNNLKGIVGGSWQLLRQIRAFRASHIHSGSTANVLNFLPALLLTRLPLVFRAGDVPPQHHWLWRMVWRFTSWRAAHFVCISRFIQNTLVDMGIPPEKASVIYSAPPSRGKSNDSALHEVNGVGLTYAYVGQLIPEKGVAEFVDAAIMHCKHFPDSHFLIAGDFSWNNPFAASLMARVSAAGLTGSIRFLGYVAAVDQLLGQANVHICPSLCEEGLGNVVSEAKQAGVPSVIFPSGGLPELVTHGTDGYVCGEKTATALANAFATYAQNPALTKEQGKAARASLTQFGVDRFAENWRGIYGRVKQPRILALFGNVPLYGQERGNIEALDALRRTGCEVLFLIREEWTRDTIQAELTRRGLPFVFVPYFDAVRHGVSLRVWWNNLKGIAGGSWQLLRQIRAFRASHIHSGSTANVLNFLPALLLTRLPLVFRAGDVPPQHHWLWRMAWRFTSWRAAHFVCDSRFIRDKLADLGIEQDRMTVVYAPAPRRSAPGTSLAPSEQSGQAKLFTVLYTGQISQEKGVHLLIEAALTLCRKRQDIRFLLAGDYAWNNPFGQALVESVNKAGLQDRILFTGFVEDIDALYRQSNLHVGPSLCEEAYGLTVMEAKERGVPSIVFASGGLVELVQHGVDGCVCAEKTAAALVTAISKYLEHPGLAPLQGTAARESLARLGLGHFAENWKEVYEKAGS